MRYPDIRGSAASDNPAPRSEKQAGSPRSFGSAKPPSTPSIGERSDFFVSLLPRVAVFPLEQAGELIALPAESRQVVVGQLVPLFLHQCRELLPVAGDQIPRHEVASSERTYHSV